MGISFVVPGDPTVKVASGHVKVDDDNDLSIYINDIRVAYFASSDGGRLTTMALTQREIDELELIGFAFGCDKRLQVRS